MNPEKWQRVKEIFNEAIELDASQQNSFLQNHAEKDTVILTEVCNLLDAEKKISDTEPLVNFGCLWQEEAAEDYIGKEIGDYKIARQIGHGGMGIVFEAVREAEDFRQIVALKLLKRGMDSDAMLRRFRSERRILASLEHPNIARLFDGGRSVEGTPFFAMEFVRGVPIDEFCDSRNLSVNERLRLFLQVCAAVSFAHSRLVVHRDLKPSNILVTDDGTVKLLDFGIAKTISPDDDSQNHTVTALVMMTPRYASPEQISGAIVSTASDIYSLGLILFELLTGSPAYNFPNNRPDEIAKIICEVEPPRPSSVISGQWSQTSEKTDQTKQITSNNRLRETSPKFRIQNPKSLRGDLDNIILKSLNKNPARRYASVEQFANDIKRHLEGLPVIARPDTFSYRLEKFVKRNRGYVLTGILVFLTLTGGIAATSWQAYRAEQERIRAEKRFRQVRELANNVVFKYHDEIKDLQGATKVRQVLVADALKYLDSLREESAEDEALTREIAQAYIRTANVQGGTYQANLGDSKGASESYQKAISLLEPLAAKSQDAKLLAELREAYVESGRAFFRTGDFARQSENLQKALALGEKIIGLQPQDLESELFYSRTLIHLADTFPENEIERRLETYRKSFAIADRLLKENPNHETVNRLFASSTHRIQLHLYLLAANAKKIGDVEKQKNLLREALSYVQRSGKAVETVSALKPDNQLYRRNAAGAKLNEGKIYRELGDVDSALRLANEALETQTEIAKADAENQEIKLDLKESYEDIALAYVKSGDYRAAQNSFRRAVELNEQILQKDRDNYEYWIARMRAERVFADAFLEKGEKQKAKEFYQNAVAIAEHRVPKKFAEAAEKFKNEVIENLKKCA